MRDRARPLRGEPMFVKLPRFLCVAVISSGLAVLSVLAQTPAPGFDPAEPKGVEVQARGPVHEAFATPTAEPMATPLIPKKPPAQIEEMPPAEKPDGDVAWIGGYW